jgi:hypothetical protein
MTTLLDLAKLSDGDLLLHVRRLTADERGATARLIAALAEFDARRLYLGEGCSSLFTYCTQVLHLSEHAAYGRIEAARAARRFPVVVERLAAGEVTLTTVTLLAPHLTPSNHQDLLDAAKHKGKRDVERQIAELRPRPAIASSIRRLPVHQSGAHPSPGLPPPEGLPPTPTSDSPAAQGPAPAAPAPPGPPWRIASLAPDRYRVQFTMSAATHDKLRRVQDLLRHVSPTGDPAEVFDRALTVLLTQLERRRMAVAARPRTAAALPAPAPTEPRQAAATPPQRSRYVPAALRRAVWTRDDGRCAFVGTQGRCTERGLLEMHHVVPFAEGGLTTIDNLELRCRAHNAHEARLWADDLWESAAQLGPDRATG